MYPSFLFVALMLDKQIIVQYNSHPLKILNCTRCIFSLLAAITVYPLMR
jgi:hypothetical protein